MGANRLKCPSGLADATKPRAIVAAYFLSGSANTQSTEPPSGTFSSGGHSYLDLYTVAPSSTAGLPATFLGYFDWATDGSGNPLVEP